MTDGDLIHVIPGTHPGRFVGCDHAGCGWTSREHATSSAATAEYATHLRDHKPRPKDGTDGNQ